MKLLLSVARNLGVILLVYGCTDPPTLVDIQPNPVFPRQIVGVDGSTFGAVRWDAGRKN